MTRPSSEDMIVLRMGVDTLLASVRQAEAWWRAQGDAASLRRTRLLMHAILATGRKFCPRAGAREANGNMAGAFFVADRLRDAARQCHEG